MKGIDRRKGIIISYQRSGLNWVRYCIEYLTGLRTSGQTKLLEKGDLAVYRTHNIKKKNGPNSIACRFYDEQGQPIHNKVVLLLRDYRESFLRVAKGRGKGVPTVEDIQNENIFNFKNYFENLKAYDKFRGPKLLIWYHDLIDDFSQITKILDFLGLYYDLEDFDLEYHRRKSVEIYDGQHQSYTKRNLQDFQYHQNNVDLQVLEALDAFVDKNYRNLATKYLRLPLLLKSK